MESTTLANHQWTPLVMKNAPALKCAVCGFVWKTNMRKPRVTCDQIMNNPRPLKKNEIERTETNG